MLIDWALTVVLAQAVLPGCLRGRSVGVEAVEDAVAGKSAVVSIGHETS